MKKERKKYFKTESKKEKEGQKYRKIEINIDRNKE